MGSVIDLAKCIIRHIAIVGFRMHLCVPKQLVKGLALNYEAFSNPFNRVLDGEYCSLFEEDKLYGSRGSFFEETSISNFRVLANPSFQLDFLEMATSHLVKLMNVSSNFLVLYFVPYSWGDSRYYKEILECGYLKQKVDLDREKHYYVGKYVFKDYCLGRKNSKIKSTVFVLSDTEPEFDIRKVLESVYGTDSILDGPKKIESNK